DFILEFRKDRIRDFLARHQLKVTGTKEELRAIIQEALAASQLTYANIIEFLDAQEPWNKQHVYVFKGPVGLPTQWRQRNFVDSVLSKNGLAHLSNSRQTFILPT